MAKRSTGDGMWLAIGVLVLAAVIPRKVWIGAGVIGASAVVVYLIIKQLRLRADAKRDAYRHEPTLAELIAARPAVPGLAARADMAESKVMEPQSLK